jgi:hypothetical protein
LSLFAPFRRVFIPNSIACCENNSKSLSGEFALPRQVVSLVVGKVVSAPLLSSCRQRSSIVLMLSMCKSFAIRQAPCLVFVSVLLFYHTSPTFLLRASGQISTRLPAGVVFVLCCVRLPEVFVLWLICRSMKVFAVSCHMMGATG